MHHRLRTCPCQYHADEVFATQCNIEAEPLSHTILLREHHARNVICEQAEALSVMCHYHLDLRKAHWLPNQLNYFDPSIRMVPVKAMQRCCWLTHKSEYVVEECIMEDRLESQNWWLSNGFSSCDTTLVLVSLTSHYNVSDLSWAWGLLSFTLVQSFAWRLSFLSPIFYSFQWHRPE